MRLNSLICFKHKTSVCNSTVLLAVMFLVNQLLCFECR